MAKSAKTVIKQTANSIFMKTVKRDHGLSDNQVEGLISEFILSGTKLSLAHFVAVKFAKTATMH